ncbi:MAG TPA: phage tail sheath subtilisin-like domain-containing protein [Pyrinomonadaceae bacterium]|jgi:phage tail sheath protein FI|nr:phage tail sheath subtilisin-like domain-containing protein [Pyrinomonadaceae bacterium]
MSLTVETTTPGVTALVNQGQVARPIERQPSSTAFLGGYGVWGPVGVPVIISSWLEFVRKFGGFNANSYLADAVFVFFQLYGGAQAVISRAVGPTPVVGTKSLMDGAGTPVATIRVDAKYPSSDVDIKVQVAVGTAANSRKLIFTSVYLNITETFDSVTLATADLADISEKSKLVNLTNLSSATAAPNNLPAVAAAASLTGGTDDFASIGAANYTATLTPFADSNLGGGQVSIPGITTSAVLAALKAHAETYSRLAILDSPFGTDVAGMLALDTAAWRSLFAALYYPWVKMQRLDGVNNTKFYPPSIFALGACAQVDRTQGTHKAPANVSVPGAIDVERNSDGSPMFTDAARGNLNAKQINVIAPITTEGIKIYGERLLYPAGETRVRFVHERRLLNLVYYSARIGYSWAVFQVVDGTGRLFRDLKASGANFLRTLWRDGAFYGKTEAEAFVVTADVSNNPPEELAQGRVHVQMGVKLSPTAEQVIINIDSVPLGQDLSVLNGGTN